MPCTSTFACATAALSAGAVPWAASTSAAGRAVMKSSSRSTSSAAQMRAKASLSTKRRMRPASSFSAISDAVSFASTCRSRSAGIAVSSVPACFAAARAAKSACSRKAWRAVPISAAVRPSFARKPGRSSVVCSALWTMPVTLTLAGTWASSAAGYCQAKPCRSASVRAGSACASGLSSSSGSGGSTPSGSACCTVRVMVLPVSAKGSSRSSASRRRGPPLGWTSRAARSQSAKLFACRPSVCTAPASRKAAALVKGLEVFPMPSGTVRMSLSCARVSAT